MKRFGIFSASIFISFAVVSCAHHRDVRPGADGIHRVVVTGEDKETASQDALSQANHFCSERNLSAAIIEENQKYTGDMDEKTYKDLKTGAKVAQVAGGALAVFGGKNESLVGTTALVGGSAAHAVAGKGYTAVMKFKCM